MGNAKILHDFLDLLEAELNEAPNNVISNIDYYEDEEEFETYFHNLIVEQVNKIRNQEPQYFDVLFKLSNHCRNINCLEDDDFEDEGHHFVFAISYPTKQELMVGTAIIVKEKDADTVLIEIGYLMDEFGNSDWDYEEDDDDDDDWDEDDEDWEDEEDLDDEDNE